LLLTPPAHPGVWSVARGSTIPSEVSPCKQGRSNHTDQMLPRQVASAFSSPRERAGCAYAPGRPGNRKGSSFPCAGCCSTPVNKERPAFACGTPEKSPAKRMGKPNQTPTPVASRVLEAVITISRARAGAQGREIAPRGGRRRNGARRRRGEENENWRRRGADSDGCVAPPRVSASRRVVQDVSRNHTIDDEALPEGRRAGRSRVRA